jgi:hypothetical protein
MASRGRGSLGACASNRASVRSAQSAAQMASTRRSSSLNVKATRLTSHTYGFSGGAGSGPLSLHGRISRAPDRVRPSQMAQMILASVQTFLDLGSRAERHRQAAVAYKKLLRKFERIPVSEERTPETAQDGDVAGALGRLEEELSEVDGAAPVVPRGIASRVEGRPMEIAHTAGELAE